MKSAGAKGCEQRLRFPVAMAPTLPIDGGVHAGAGAAVSDRVQRASYRATHAHEHDAALDVLAPILVPARAAIWRWCPDRNTRRHKACPYNPCWLPWLRRHPATMRPRALRCSRGHRHPVRDVVTRTYRGSPCGHPRCGEKQRPARSGWCERYDEGPVPCTPNTRRQRGPALPQDNHS